MTEDAKPDKNLAGLKKSVLVFGCAVVGIVVVSLLAFMPRNTPRQCLLDVKEAYVKRDYAAIEKMIDVKQVFSQMYKLSEAEIYDRRLSDDQVEKGYNNVKEILVKFVELHEANANLYAYWLIPGFLMMFDDPGAIFKSIKSVKTEGKISIASIEMENSLVGKSYIIDVVLRNAEDKWMIVGVQNYDSVFREMYKDAQRLHANVLNNLLSKGQDKFGEPGVRVESGKCNIGSGVINFSGQLVNLSPHRINVVRVCGNFIIDGRLVPATFVVSTTRFSTSYPFGVHYFDSGTRLNFKGTLKLKDREIADFSNAANIDLCNFVVDRVFYGEKQLLDYAPVFVEQFDNSLAKDILTGHLWRRTAENVSVM